MSERGERIIKSLQSVIDFQNGDKTKCRVRNHEIPDFEPVQEFSKEEIKSIRLKVNLPQTCFAELLGVSSRSVEAWEAGKRKPTGAANRLFQLIEKEPRLINIMVKQKKQVDI